MVYCCFWLAIVTSFSVGQAGTVRQVYRISCHKSTRILCAVRFLFQFRVDAGNQLVRRRCGRFCRKYRRDTEPSAADQHLALFFQGMPPHTFLRRAFSLSRADSRRASLRRNDSSVTVLMISLFFLYGDGSERQSPYRRYVSRYILAFSLLMPLRTYNRCRNSSLS